MEENLISLEAAIVSGDLEEMESQFREKGKKYSEISYTYHDSRKIMLKYIT